MFKANQLYADPHPLRILHRRNQQSGFLKSLVCVYRKETAITTWISENPIHAKSRGENGEILYYEGTAFAENRRSCKLARN
jgi:hypothetical protein